MTMIMGEIALLSAQILGTLAEYHNDPAPAATDADLRRAWADAEPETRAAMLLSHAWQTRTGTLPASAEDAAHLYATELHTYARDHTGDGAAFTGPAWPAMPLPGRAGALASSLGFDRDDLDISLLCLLLLATAGD